MVRIGFNWGFWRKKRTVIFSEDIGDKFTTLTYGYDVARGIFSLIGQK